MQIKNRNLFRVTRQILFKLPYILRLCFPFRKTEKRLLIIKLDAIGDYILFRNFLEIIRNSEKYKDYEIDLLGNEIWKDLALTYDQPFITNFYFTKPFALYELPFEYLKLGWKLFVKKYEVVLQPTYSRTLIVDGLAATTLAKEIIGFESDTELIYQKYKKKTDKFYTQKLKLPGDIIFEFERGRYFFEQIIEAQILLLRPNLPSTISKDNHIVFFTGAGYIKREWGIDKFLSLAEHILKNTNYTIVLAGSKSEEPHAEYLLNKLPQNKIISQIGKTTLPELIDLIAASQCVISNDTSAVHIAAACNTPVICIHGVAHYKRFIPYPTHISNKLIFIYEKMACFNCNWVCIYKTQEKEPFPCVAINSVEQVWQAFAKLLPG